MSKTKLLLACLAIPSLLSAVGCSQQSYGLKLKARLENLLDDKTAGGGNTRDKMVTPEDITGKWTLPADITTGTVISSALTNTPSHGQATMKAGIVTYIPAANFFGNDSVKYKIISTVPAATPSPAAAASGVSSQTAAVTQVTTEFTLNIEVTPVNDLPVAKDLSLNGAQNKSVEFNLGLPGDFSDVEDGENLVLQMPPTTARGGTVQLTDPAAKKYSYLPPADFKGSDQIVYTIGDTEGGEGHGTIVFNIDSTIYSIKPALAVRGSGCIMCHGIADSNVITDFGYGSPYYFGQNQSGVSAYSRSAYGDHAENWLSAQVSGNVIVPKNALIPLGDAGGDGAKTLASYLGSKVGASKVVEKSTVYIGAPTAGRILSVAGSFPSDHPSWTFNKHAPSSPNFSGLTDSSNGQYLRNSAESEFVCVGDLIVKKVLFLENLKLRTTSQGCRIYATESVFIQGAITYIDDGANPDRNLQIVSSRAVLMGFGKAPAGTERVGTDSVNYRFGSSGNRETALEAFATRATGGGQAAIKPIFNDAMLIGMDTLKDAATTNYANGPNTTGYRLVPFERLMLVAPQVHSRYFGQVKGVIIAEVAMLGVSHLQFTFDPVFERAPVLPLLEQKDFLIIED
jgi:hypothetical protein